MNRTRIVLLLGALVLVAAGVGYWLLRPPPTPPEPAPLPPGEIPPDAAESISRLRRELEQLRQGGKTRVMYRAGTAEELTSYRHWVSGQLRLAARGTPAEAPQPDGFRLLTLGNAGTLLAEQQEERRGAGAVALRAGPARPWVVEVPHSFYDEGTLEIGLNAFVWSQARALLVNTVHRYRALAQEPAEAGESDDEQGAISDVAHAEASFFLTAHAALVDELGEAGVVQLHGFSDASAPSADLVLSASGSLADPAPVAQALEQALGIRVAVYPTEIRKLGGTKNRQARYSISVGKPFLHVEMSRSLRRQLTTDPEQLRRFVSALLGSPA